MNIRAYLGIPLTLKNGSCLGSFCALDNQIKNWEADDLAIMQELGEIIVSEFNLRAEVYADASRQPELDDLHQRINDFISGLDTSLPKDEFLLALGVARTNCNL